ncbi:MAG TPA: asparagine synthase (glutamine-hydrolyzing) [Nitrospira sp.]|nr:asparagine synthase (glutamine-hydrolyzing) [Nitrospira sp.]
MCGIVGLWADDRLELRDRVSRMVGAIRYRGPDDCGIWCDPSVGLGLGHARLSILDLSPEGHQPMISASGRYVMTYNGEVYNFAELRKDLERGGPRFRGHSDTEVMLAAIEAWGLDRALEKFVGMFAFGLWDRESRLLHLVRDRMGIKPLYYGWVGDTFCFGSELKALRQTSSSNPPLNREALTSYVRTGYVPAPFSIYRDIYKLPGGTVLTIHEDLARARSRFSADPDGEGEPFKPVRYWSARAIAEANHGTPSLPDEGEAINELESLLREAIRLRMVADVPLGAFLSGGIDSSLVVALMQSQSSRPVKTFTIGFHEAPYNEAPYAKAVARHLGTDHVEEYVTADQAMAAIPRIPDVYDEPFGDSSQIPTMLLSHLARQHVTVALSGDGGDELFAGYHRYFVGRRLWRRMKVFPAPIREVLAQAIRAVPPAGWSKLFHVFRHILPEMQNPGDKLHKLAEVLAVSTPDSMYVGLVSQWKDPALLMINGTESKTVLTDVPNWPRVDDFTMRMMILDLLTYLPDDILTKVDRASMAVSLEARVPLLDHRLVEFAWRIPLSMKIKRDGEGKWMLRQILYRHVPKALVERPKMGFGIPIDCWLRGPLREWAEDLLSERRLREEGYFYPVPIRTKWTEHLSGEQNWQYPLWNILMFQAWLHAHDRTPTPAVSHH